MMKNTTEKKEPAMKKTLLMFLLVCSIGLCIFTGLYLWLRIDWMESVAITFGMFVYHIVIRFLSPGFLCVFTGRKYDYQSPWFRPKKWEKRLYEFLKVKKWKGKAWTYDPRQFSVKYYSLEEIVNNMCHAEAGHELIMVLSFTSLFFAIPFGVFYVFLITAIMAALLDSVFVIIQRYNRPRVVKLMEGRKHELD